MAKTNAKRTTRLSKAKIKAADALVRRNNEILDRLDFMSLSRASYRLDRVHDELRVIAGCGGVGIGTKQREQLQEAIECVHNVRVYMTCELNKIIKGK